MKYINIIFILSLGSILLNSCYPKNNNVSMGTNFLEINYDEAIFIELNQEEISIIDTVINQFVNRWDILDKIYVNKYLFVDNLFYGSCGCFDDNNKTHEYTYEFMVKNEKYYLEGMGINNELIESFINKNIQIWQINNMQFTSEISLEKEISGSQYFEFTFSNIGINYIENEALLHVSTNNRRGTYISLIKNNEIWIIIDENISWSGP